MELIEIAQLVTGLATLIVASVLIWQMIIQKRTLDIAHNDADSSMSLSAVENKINLNTWYSELLTPETLEKLDKGLDFLSPKEKQLLVITEKQAQQAHKAGFTLPPWIAKQADTQTIINCLLHHTIRRR